MQDKKYSTDFVTRQREVSTIRKDVASAYGIIRDGLSRYKKNAL